MRLTFAARRTLLALSVACTALACGGGGASAPPPTASPPTSSAADVQRTKASCSGGDSAACERGCLDPRGRAGLLDDDQRRMCEAGCDAGLVDACVQQGDDHARKHSHGTIDSYAKACELGDARGCKGAAQRLLGELIDSMSHLPPIDEAKGLALLKKGCEMEADRPRSGATNARSAACHDLAVYYRAKRDLAASATAAKRACQISLSPPMCELMQKSDPQLHR